MGIHIGGWEQIPVVWCKGISEMFGDVWDRGGVKIDVKKCFWNDGCTSMVDAFGKETLT